MTVLRGKITISESGDEPRDRPARPAPVSVLVAQVATEHEMHMLGSKQSCKPDPYITELVLREL
jgi:hypothetical protein